MNRTDFMNQLENLLQNISPAEREEAIQYYNDYFDDAGEENEQSVLEALGTPAKVAENIKRDLYGTGYVDDGFGKAIPVDKALTEYRQNGAQQNGAQQNDAYRNDAWQNGDYRNDTAWQSDTQQNATQSAEISHYKEKGTGTKLPTGVIVLIVVLCILASPLILGVGSGLLGTLVGIVAGWFAMIVGFGAAAIALLVVMCVLAVVGVACMFSDVLVGVVMLGAGMICGGIGILFLMLTVAMAGIVTPAICRGIVSLFRLIRGKLHA